MYIAYGAGFGWIYAAYSIIFQYLSTMVINRTYKRYAKVTLEFTTENPDVVVEAFMKATRHGMSVIEARGGFSGKNITFANRLWPLMKFRESLML